MRDAGLEHYAGPSSILSTPAEDEYAELTTCFYRECKDNLLKGRKALRIMQFKKIKLEQFILKMTTCSPSFGEPSRNGGFKQTPLSYTELPSRVGRQHPVTRRNRTSLLRCRRRHLPPGPPRAGANTGVGEPQGEARRPGGQHPETMLPQHKVRVSLPLQQELKVQPVSPRACFSWRDRTAQRKVASRGCLHRTWACPSAARMTPSLSSTESRLARLSLRVGCSLPLRP